MVTPSSVLAWRIPGTVEPGGLPSMGLHRVGHDWSNLAATAVFQCIYVVQLLHPFICSWIYRLLPSFQFSSVAQSCPTFATPCIFCSTPGLPVHHQLLELTQTHVHQIGDAIQSSYPLTSASPPALNLSQHQGLFQGISSSHQVVKVLEFQLQHQSFQ